MIDINLYSSFIEVVLLEDLKDCKKYIKNINKKYKQENEMYKFEGCIFELPNRNYQIVFVKDFININLISHECYHCSEKIADSCDLTSTGNKEERAYLNAYINEKVVEHLKKLKIPIFT